MARISLFLLLRDEKVVMHALDPLSQAGGVRAGELEFDSME